MAQRGREPLFLLDWHAGRDVDLWDSDLAKYRTLVRRPKKTKKRKGRNG